MANRDPENRKDAALDSALREHGDARPRPGLEGRVLANLRAERERLKAGRKWWPAPVAVAVSAILIIGAAIFLGRTHDNTREQVAAERTPMVRQNSPGVRVASVPAANTSRATKITRRVRPVLANRPAEPRLDQFPSPQPLSDQEQLLARYVQELPSEARQIAQAQTELARQDQIEFEKQDQLENPSGNSLP